MSVIPHPTKHRTIKGETWWYVDTGKGRDRKRYPLEGSFADAKKMELNIRQNTPGKKIPDSPAIKDLILPFLAWYKGEVATTTYEDINDTISIYVIPHFGNLQPEQLTVSRFNDFKLFTLEKGLKPVTVNKHLNYFSSLLRWAADNVDGVQELPFRIPRFPKKKTQSEKVQPLTKRQVDAIYGHIQLRHRLSFLLMADMGLRAFEALNLTVEDVNEKNKCITFIGKGNKERTVPYMSDRFENEINKVLNSRLDGYLVINPKSGKPYVTIRRELERAVKLAGLSRYVNHHLLRHTFASLTAEGGISPYVLQKLLGHSSIDTTMKIYTHISKNFIGDEVAKFRKKN